MIQQKYSKCKIIGVSFSSARFTGTYETSAFSCGGCVKSCNKSYQQIQTKNKSFPAFCRRKHTQFACRTSSACLPGAWRGRYKEENFDQTPRRFEQRRLFQRIRVFQSANFEIKCWCVYFLSSKMVKTKAPTRFELVTFSLQDRRSATELRSRFSWLLLSYQLKIT